jgi:hypothetical protein
MKAVLEFDLDNEEDMTNYKMMNMATNMHVFIWQYDQELRRKVKYDDSLTDEQYKVWEQARELFYNKLNEYKIDLDL